MFPTNVCNNYYKKFEFILYQIVQNQIIIDENEYVRNIATLWDCLNLVQNLNDETKEFIKKNLDYYLKIYLENKLVRQAHGFLALGLNKLDQEDPQVKAVLKTNDINVNVNWPLAHYKSAVRYLARDKEDVAATGGTNWQKYLPPRFQKRIFYPDLWSSEEVDNWGKGWVEDTLNDVN